MKKPRGLPSRIDAKRRASEDVWCIRWILKILHDLKYLIPWELWYYSILMSSRIFYINSSKLQLRC